MIDVYVCSDQGLTHQIKDVLSSPDIKVGRTCSLSDISEPSIVIALSPLIIDRAKRRLNAVLLTHRYSAEYSRAFKVIRLASKWNLKALLTRSITALRWLRGGGPLKDDRFLCSASHIVKTGPLQYQVDERCVRREIVGRLITMALVDSASEHVLVTYGRLTAYGILITYVSIDDHLMGADNIHLFIGDVVEELRTYYELLDHRVKILC